MKPDDPAPISLGNEYCSPAPPARAEAAP